MATKKLSGAHQYAEFKDETVEGRIRAMVDIRESLDSSSLHVKLSYGNRKCTAQVPSVSLIPGADCGNCKMCKRGCYALRNVCCYQGSRKQWASNSALYKQEPDRYFKEIEMMAHFLRFFRWHVGGDIKDAAYLANMVKVARNVPECEFLCFTKMFDVVNDYLDLHGSFPSNLHIILSGWRDDRNENRHNLPVSSPVWRDGERSCMATEDAVWCSGNCAECAEGMGGCWSARNGQTILFVAH